MIQDWSYKFANILRNISTEDLKTIVTLVDLSANHTAWNQEVPIYQTVVGSVTNIEQIKIILESKNPTLAKMDVSANFNQWLLVAFWKNDIKLMRKLVTHPTFTYPGSGSYNRYTRREELTPLYKILKRYQKEEFEWYKIQALYDLLPRNFRCYFIADYFTALNLLDLPQGVCHQWVSQGLEIFYSFTCS